MKLQINRSKPKMIGMRLPDEAFDTTKAMAEKEGVSHAEICRALILAALMEIKKIGKP